MTGENGVKIHKYLVVQRLFSVFYKMHFRQFTPDTGHMQTDRVRQGDISIGSSKSESL